MVTSKAEQQFKPSWSISQSAMTSSLGGNHQHHGRLRQANESIISYQNNIMMLLPRHHTSLHIQILQIISPPSTRKLSHPSSFCDAALWFNKINHPKHLIHAMPYQKNKNALQFVTMYNIICIVYNHI